MLAQKIYHNACLCAAPNDSNFVWRNIESCATKNENDKEEEEGSLHLVADMSSHELLVP